MNVCILYSTAMLEESQDGMDSGTLSPASARQVTIQRHPTQGFGFIAGSQRPVIVRSVSVGECARRLEQNASGDATEYIAAQMKISFSLYVCDFLSPQTAPPLASFSLETRSWPLTRRR